MDVDDMETSEAAASRSLAEARRAWSAQRAAVKQLLEVRLFTGLLAAYYQRALCVQEFCLSLLVVLDGCRQRALDATQNYARSHV